MCYTFNLMDIILFLPSALHITFWVETEETLLGHNLFSRTILLPGPAILLWAADNGLSGLHLESLW